MSGGVQRDLKTVETYRFPIVDGLQVDIFPQAGPENSCAACCRQIVPVPPACVIAMPMGNDGIFHRLPGINIKVADAAKKAGLGWLKQVAFLIHGYDLN